MSESEVVPPIPEILSAEEIAYVNVDEFDLVRASHEALRAERDYFRRRLEEMLPAWDTARRKGEPPMSPEAPAIQTHDYSSDHETRHG